MPEITVDIKPRGTASAYIEAPFDTGKQALESQGYRIISLEENARLRVQEGEQAFISQNGNWVREGAIYVKGKGAFLTKASPIMINPKAATDCHRAINDFYLNQEQLEQALADSFPISGNSIPTSSFGEKGLTNYAFGGFAKEYGEFLKEAGIKEMPIWLADIQEKPFVIPVWFCRLGYARSGLLCSNRSLLDGVVRVR
ncbi:MAG TPA: hypothetical protein VJH95_03330, partial [Candidatus Nanoarchaeia archaeon]|nr:hypothetical protein [Candidatus Nanoarchaeia archaeon]